MDDINEAHTKLYDSRNKWFEIGQALHVEDVILDSIRKRYANDGSTCLREMLDHRLKSGPPLTWKELLNTQYGMQDTYVLVNLIRTIPCIYVCCQCVQFYVLPYTRAVIIIQKLLQYHTILGKQVLDRRISIDVLYIIYCMVLFGVMTIQLL